MTYFPVTTGFVNQDWIETQFRGKSQPSLNGSLSVTRKAIKLPLQHFTRYVS